MSKRNYEEASEKLQNVVNEAPADKYQNTQQVAPSTGLNVKAGTSKYVPEKEKISGSQLRQEVAAKVIHDAAVGGSNAGDGATFGGLRSSGSVGGVLGAANATPVAGQVRGKDRITKKLDRNSTKLNYIPNDQVLVEWDESKPLADAAADGQGFNGTYRNEFARLQKNKESVPGGLMFDRSVDLLVKDNVYFGEGQVVRQGDVNLMSDLDQTATQGALGIYDYPDSENTVNYLGGAVGNYLTTEVKIQLDSTGKPVYTEYVEEDLSTHVDQFDANKASVQDHILMNDAELVRETMDSKAGDEKAEIWTPLARAVRKPTALVGFLRDMEAEVGNELLTAYRKASTSLSYQLNRAHKDGQDSIQPGVEALVGFNKNYISKAAFKEGEGTSLTGVFTKQHYKAGDASTMIALYDSVVKYNTKADMLLQPRGLRMHLQTADNNIDPFYANKLFVQAYDNQEVFSTIDHDYDPMLPVCMTDKASVVHRLSWHRLGSYVNSRFKLTCYDKGKMTETDVHGIVLIPASLVSEIKTAGYNVYITTIKDTNGNITHSGGVIRPSGNFNFAGSDDKTVTVTIAMHDAEAPFNADTQQQLKIANAQLVDGQDLIWDGYSDASHTYYANEITILPNSEKIYCYMGGPARYQYSDLRNSYAVEVEHPLLKGFDMYLCDSIGGKYNAITHPTAGANADQYIEPISIKTGHSTMYYSLWSFLLCAATPFIAKARINSMRDVLYYTKNVEYPFSSTLISVKDVRTKAYSNFNYKDYDTELDSGLMLPSTALTWMMPELFQQVGFFNSRAAVMLPWYTNQNAVCFSRDAGDYVFDDDASSMSFPSVRSGVRMAALDALYGMKEEDIRLCFDMIASFKALNPTLADSKTYKYSSVCDGQLILSVDKTIMNAETVMRLPRELGFFFTAPYGTLTPNYSHERNYNESVLGKTSFRCYYWYGENPVGTADNGTQCILEPVAINVNRAQNFRQDWYCVLASGTIPAVDHGFFLSAAHAFSNRGALLAGRTSFTPFATLADNGVIAPNGMNTIRSLQKYLWTRIQKLPFVISPFDGLTITDGSDPNSVVLNDPFDLLYVFGLGGFRASDYRECVYNREKEAVNQGILFVSDPWVEKSPVFKDGSLTSGITVSKGFEL